MSQTLDERAREAADALRTAAALRPDPAAETRPRASIRVALTAAVVVVALSLGAFIALRSASPGRNGGGGAPSSSEHPATGQYRAWATLLANALHKSSVTELRQDALLIGIGIVPRRAAAALHFTGNPNLLAVKVHTSVDFSVAAITITSTQPTATEALRIVNAFASAFVGYLADVDRAQYHAQVVQALGEENFLDHQLTQLEQQIIGAGGQGKSNAVLLARQAAAATQYRLASKKYAALIAAGVGTPRYRLIEASTAVRIVPADGGSSRGILKTTLAVIALFAVLALGYWLGRRRRRPSPVS